MIKILSVIVFLLTYSCSTQSQQQTQFDEVDGDSQLENSEDQDSTDEENTQNNYDDENSNDEADEGNNAAGSEEEYEEQSESSSNLNSAESGEEPDTESSNGLDDYEENEDSSDNYESGAINSEADSLNANSDSQSYNTTFNAESGYNQGESINSVNEEVSDNSENPESMDQVSVQNEANTENTETEEVTDEYGEEGSDESESYDVLPVFDQLVWLGHYINYKKREVQIKILTKGSPVFEVFQEKNRSLQPELVIRFFETNLRNKIKWDINASEFHSPVAYVRPRLDEYNGVVDVVLTVRDNVKPRFMSENSNITLTFPIPKKYDGDAIASIGEDATEEGEAVSLVGVNLTPKFEENTELPSSLSYLAEQGATSDDEGAEAAEVSSGVGVDDVMTPEQPYDEEGLPANFEEVEGDETEGDNLLMNLEPIREFNILTVAQDNVYEPEANNAASEDFTNNSSGNGFSELATDGNSSNLNSAQEAYDTYEASDQSSEASNAQDVQPGYEAEASYGGNVLSLEFVDSELGLVLQTLQEETGNNFIIPSELRSKKVTVSFKNVPWDEALKAILEAYQLGMVKVGETIVRIDEISKLAAYITELQKIKNIEIKREPTKVLVMRLNSAKADLVEPNLRKILASDILLDNRVNTSFDIRTNSIVVEAPERILSKVKNILKRLDIETPQVEIASRIVSVSKNNSHSFGVAWTGSFNFDPGRGLSFGSLNFPNSIASSFSVDPGISTLASSGATRLKFGSINNFLDLDLFLKMEEKKGSVNVLQSNKVIVLDGQKANVLQGTTQYFRVLAPTEGSVVSVPQLAEVQFNLELDVTPRISADGNVQMQLRVTSDSPSDTSGDQAANKNTKEVTTNMMRRSGETGVIGGIYDTIKQTTELGIPFFSDLPIVGVLFKSTSTSVSQQEFLVMVTPRVLERSNFDSSTNDMDTSSDSYDSTKENVYENTADTSNNYQEPEENFEEGDTDDFANTSDPEGNEYEAANTANNEESENTNQANSANYDKESENSNGESENTENISEEDDAAEPDEENSEDGDEALEQDEENSESDENYSDDEDAGDDDDDEDYEGEE